MKVISRLSNLGLLAGILAIFSPSQLSAQCVNTALGSNCTRAATTTTVEILPNAGCGNFTTSTNYSPGTYFRIPVLNGGCYTISTCGAPFDTQIGCFQGTATTGPFAYNDDNGPMCSGTPASVNMVPNFTDYARIDVRQYSCQPGGSSSINVFVRQNNNLAITSSTSDMCQGQTRTLSAVPAPVTVTPQAGAGNVGTFTGTGVSGTTFTAPTPSGPGQSFVITYTFGYCSTTTGISVFRAPTTSNAGNNQTVCTSSASISANNPTFGTGSWSVVSGSGTITSPSSASTSVTGLVAGQSVTLRWTISNGPCTPSTSDVIVTREVEPTQAVVGADLQVCSDTVTLSGNLPSVGTGTWSVLSGSGTFSNPNSPNPTVTGLTLGLNKYVWSISNGVCPAKRDTITVQRDDQAPTPFAGPDKSICGSSTTLTGNIPPFGNGNWAIISGSGVITSPTQPNSTITNVNVGTTVVTWNIGNGTCPVRSDTMIITRHPLPTAPAVSGGQTICNGSSATLTASSAASSPTYLWWDAPTAGNLLSSGPTYVTPPVTSNITVYAEVEDGITTCVSSRTPYALTVTPLPTVNLGADTTICSDDILCLDAGPGMTSYLWNTGVTTRTLCTNVSGTYYVVVTDANGCDAYDTISVIAYAPPVVNLGPDQTLCTGNTRTLSVPNDPDNSYLWSNGATTNSITVSTGGTYTITVTNQFGCSDVDTVLVNQFNAPVAAFSIDSSGCPVIAFSDQSTDANSWTWSFGNGATAVGASSSYNYQNSGNGIYQVAMIATGICGSDTAYHNINIDCIVGIEMPNDLEITVFPNPNNGYFKMLIGGLESDATLEVYDLLGKQVYAKDLAGIRGVHEEAIDIRHASKGIYLAKLKVGELSIVKRIVVE